MPSPVFTPRFLIIAGCMIVCWLLLTEVIVSKDLWTTFESATTSLTEQLSSHYKGLDTNSASERKDQNRSEISSPRQERWPDIPNIVHYVMLLQNPDSDMLNFNFNHFLSVYSTYFWLRPDIIYIHTDASEEKIEAARNRSGWTERLCRVPGVTFNIDTTTPYVADNGHPLQGVVHRSDFLRLKAIIEYGGIYLDWDVYAFKDFKPLREMGFANVVGAERTAGPDGGLNNGVLIAVKDSNMMKTFLRAAHIVYDGGWVTASCILLTALARRLSIIPYEVMLMEADAFHPHMTNAADTAHMVFDDHPETPAEDGPPLRYYTSADGDELWDTKGQGVADWQWDGRPSPNELYAASYATHAFKNFEVAITFQYSVDALLARQSNFARMVYPAIRDAVDNGYANPGEH